MQCPEIFNFVLPKSQLHWEKFEGTVPITNKIITNFHYNHLVSVVIPESLKVPKDLTDLLSEDCEYYKILDLDICDLIDENFLCCFITSGELTLLTVDTRIDCDNCIGITPLGELIIAVDKETFWSLGLDGKISHFYDKLKSRYIITINLKDECWLTSETKLNKLKTKLKVLGEFDVIVTWHPPDQDVCPSSIAKYFSELDYDVVSCTPEATSDIIYSVKLPLLDVQTAEETEIQDFIEWLGMASLGADLETNDSNNFVNSYVTPEPNIDVGQVKHLQWQGLYTVGQIQNMLLKLSEYNKPENKQWIAMYIQGFSDSPVSWSHEEHQVFINGDNGYLVIFNNNNGMICVHKCSKKRYK